MAVDAAPSGKAPPGRLRFGAATRAPATAFPVAARELHTDNSAGLAAAGRPARTARTRAGRQLHHSRGAPSSGPST